jgi:hypothetical protein
MFTFFSALTVLLNALHSPPKLRQERLSQLVISLSAVALELDDVLRRSAVVRVACKLDIQLTGRARDNPSVPSMSLLSLEDVDNDAARIGFVIGQVVGMPNIHTHVNLLKSEVVRKQFSGGSSGLRSAIVLGHDHNSRSLCSRRHRIMEWIPAAHQQVPNPAPHSTIQRFNYTPQHNHFLLV